MSLPGHTSEFVCDNWIIYISLPREHRPGGRLQQDDSTTALHIKLLIELLKCPQLIFADISKYIMKHIVVLITTGVLHSYTYC